MENEDFKDILLHQKCFACDKNLTLMGSVRGGTDELWLVKRCLSCGGYPVEEIFRLK